MIITFYQGKVENICVKKQARHREAQEQTAQYCISERQSTTTKQNAIQFSKCNRRTLRATKSERREEAEPSVQATVIVWRGAMLPRHTRRNEWELRTRRRRCSRATFRGSTCERPAASRGRRRSRPVCRCRRRRVGRPSPATFPRSPASPSSSDADPSIRRAPGRHQRHPSYRSTHHHSLRAQRALTGERRASSRHLLMLIYSSAKAKASSSLIE